MKQTRKKISTFTKNTISLTIYKFIAYHRITSYNTVLLVKLKSVYYKNRFE